jgi:hypothetical protein
MNNRRGASGMQGKGSASSGESKNRQNAPSGIGGREFGQVIEPTQAQMASDNKGLTEDYGRQGKKPMRKKKAA